MKSIQEINEKIKSGKVVVVTAEEVASLIKKDGVKKTAENVDIVTTGTFGPMCSSGVYFNTGHTKPKIKFGGGKAYLGGVPLYAGLAAVDLFLGASSLPDDDPKNSVYPGEFKYGGGHVISDLAAGKDLLLEASTYGTDCYPRKSISTVVNVKGLNEAVLFNIRNCYQNYNVAVNTSDKIIHTYMGILKPKMGNAAYCSASVLSPLFNDPFYKVIGIGTKIFLGGGVGFVSWWGTQHNPGVERTEKGFPKRPAGTLALIGDLKGMNSKWLVGASIYGYGVSLAVGIGIPIPVLNEEVLSYTAAEESDLWAPVVDYAEAYPQGKPEAIAFVNYQQLRSGKIKIKGEDIPTGSLSSFSKAREIAGTLKDWITAGKFMLTEAVEKIPSADSGYVLKPLKERGGKDV